MMPGSKSMYKVKSALCLRKQHMGTLNILEVKGSKPPFQCGPERQIFIILAFISSISNINQIYNIYCIILSGLHFRLVLSD